ncbi:MAG: DUF1232 domain-containing protein [Acidimicrobiia bacterium]|nr:DUF1232 domain-containing protein [Acidimicrobiia bacterium]
MNEETPALRHFSDGSSEVVPQRPRTKSELLKEAALAVPHLVVLLGRLLGDPDVPRKRKVLAGFAMAYLVSPWDLLPDAIPFIGRVDDVVVLAAAINHLIKSVPDEKVNAYWEGSEDAFDIVAGIVQWGSDLLPKPIKNVLSM